MCQMRDIVPMLFFIVWPTLKTVKQHWVPSCLLCINLNDVSFVTNQNVTQLINSSHSSLNLKHKDIYLAKSEADQTLERERVWPSYTRQRELDHYTLVRESLTIIHSSERA